MPKTNKNILYPLQDTIKQSASIIDTTLTSGDTIATPPTSENTLIETGYDTINQNVISEQIDKQKKEQPGSFYFNMLQDSSAENNRMSPLHFFDSSAEQRYSDTISIKNGSQNRFPGNFRIKPTADWLFLVILFSLVLFAWSKLIYEKYISQFFVASFNYQLSFKLFLERNILFQRAAFFLNFIFYITGGLFIFLTFRHFDIGFFKFHEFFVFIIYAFILFLFYSAKYVLCSFLGYVFDSQKLFSEYLHNIFLYNKILGLLLFPVIIGVSYMPELFITPLIIIGISLVVFMYLVRIFRGFQIILKKDVFIFFLILYLCTLEILPLIFLITFFYSLI